MSQIGATLATETRLASVVCDVSDDDQVRQLFSAPYASAKRAIRGRTRTLPRNWARTPDAVRASYTEAVSLRSFIAPEDIANAVLFLNSPAGARKSGQDFIVDGPTETP